jgi:hypothetical protein
MFCLAACVKVCAEGVPGLRQPFGKLKSRGTLHFGCVSFSALRAENDTQIER